MANSRPAYLNPDNLPGVQPYLAVDSDDADSDMSESSSEADSDYSEEARAIAKEWDENVKQLQMLVTVVLLPFAGKWMGRKVAYWGRSNIFMLQQGLIVCSQHGADSWTSG